MNRFTWEEDDIEILEERAAGGPGSGWFREDGHVSKSEMGSVGKHTGEVAASTDDELITGSLSDDLDNADNSPENIQKILDHYGAKPLVIGHGNLPIKDFFVTDTHIVEWDGDSAWVTKKVDWINIADIDTYFPDYEDKLNEEFWSSGGEVYHATQYDEDADAIMVEGIEPRSQSRGISNRSEGAAVYTTTDVEETAMGSYGENVFAIDTAAMIKDGYTPYTSQEPDIVEGELRQALAHAIGLNDYVYDYEHGMSPSTIAIHGHIPAKYLRRMDK
jgi:hypothetical protein